jgi:hypothetical protein
MSNNSIASYIADRILHVSSHCPFQEAKTHLPDIHRHLKHDLPLRQRIPDRVAILVKLLPLVFLCRRLAGD